MGNLILNITGEELHNRQEQVCQGWLADPPQPQAGDCDSQLRGSDDCIRIIDCSLHPGSAKISPGNQLCNPSPPDTNQGELSRHKETIRQYQHTNCNQL